MKKILAILLALCMLLSLVACGAKEEAPATDEPATDAPAAEKPAEEPVEEPTEEKEIPTVKIRFLLNGTAWGVETCAMEEIFDAFAELHKDEVILIPEELPSEGQGAQATKMSIMAENGDAPGVFGIGISAVDPYIEAGIINDLNAIVDDEWKATNLAPGVEEEYTKYGILAGVPYETGVQGWFYNTALFEQCGLEIPETFDDMLHCVEVFNENGIVPIAQTAAEDWAIWGYQTFFHYYGFLDMVEPIRNREMKFNNEDLLKGFEKMAQLYEAGAFPENMTTMTYSQALEMFMAGNAAMICSGSWEGAVMNNCAVADDIVFDWGPKFTDGIADQNMGIMQVGQGLYACKTPDELETKWALEFVKFYHEEMACQIRVDKLDTLCPTAVALDTSKLGPVSQQLHASAVDGTTAVPLEIGMMMPDGFTTVYRQAVTGTLCGNYTPAEALDLLDNWNDTRVN